jgi:hypothetical protein
VKLNWRMVATHFLVAFMGGVIGCAAAWHIAEGAISTLSAHCAGSLNVAQQTIQSQRAVIAELKAQLLENSSEATVLYEQWDSPGTQIPMFHGTVNLSVSIPTVGHLRPRWVIPERVTPQLLDSSQKLPYTWWNPKTGEISAPMYVSAGYEPPRN